MNRVRRHARTLSILQIIDDGSTISHMFVDRPTIDLKLMNLTFILENPRVVKVSYAEAISVFWTGAEKWDLLEKPK